MKDKLEKLLDASNSLMSQFMDPGVTGISDEHIRQVMRRIMDPKEIQMFDLGLYCETEMLKAHRADAHMAACLMGAAMNEALICLMCLRFEEEVKGTEQFANSTRKRLRPFRDVVGDWSLQQFNTVVEQCGWIPRDVVDDIFKQALADGFRELMPISHPEMTAEEIEAGAQCFFDSPATALLRMTQDLRNTIHAGKWLRDSKPFVPEHFTMWCKFATHLCGEIRLCLFQRILDAELPKALEKLTDFNKMINSLPPDTRDAFQFALRAKFQEFMASEGPIEQAEKQN